MAQEKLSQIDFRIFFLITLIASIGFAMLYSAADGHMSPWAAKQILRFCVGMCMMLGVALVDLRIWMSLAYSIYAMALVLLIAVEVTGLIGMGAQRWVNLYVIQLQPSEIMKVALILALARYFHVCTVEEISRLKTLITPIILIVLPVLLVMRQPDLGTALILFISSMIVLFATGVRIWKFMVAGGGFMAAVPILWTFLHDYQKKRVLIFLNPESDPRGSGYHVTQSKIALGSGGWFGKGFMKGTQSQLNFLPEKQTDFIFTMLSEECGFFGGIILLSLYLLLLTYNLRVALRCHHHFGRLLAIGIQGALFLYIFINMAMVMGMLPVVGVPLPFVSYGGTALLTLLIGQGFIFSVSLFNKNRRGM